MDTLEVSGNGSLTVPAEKLREWTPARRFHVERVEDGLLLRPEPPLQAVSPDEWWEQFERYSKAVSEAWNSEKSAAEVVSEMRR